MTWTYWKEDEVVDGAGLTLDVHAKALVSDLPYKHARSLAAELRNALVPMYDPALPDKTCKAMERLYALAQACAVRANEEEPAPV